MQKLRYFIAKTQIDSNGKANVSFLYSKKGIDESYLSNDFNKPNMILFNDEEEALHIARNLLGPTYTVHEIYQN